MIYLRFETIAYAVVGFGSVAGATLLVASDLAGPDALAAAFRKAGDALTRPAAKKTQDLSHFKEVTLFASAKVEGSSLEVKTGVEFASIDALAAGRQTKRWCYVAVPGQAGFARLVSLGSQIGNSPPVFRDLAKDGKGDLLAEGLSISALSAIAVSHCRFLGTPPPPKVTGRVRTALGAPIAEAAR